MYFTGLSWWDMLGPDSIIDYHEFDIIYIIYIISTSQSAMPLPVTIRSPSSKTAATVLAILIAPVVLEAGYLLYLKRYVSRRTVASGGRRLPRSSSVQPASASVDPNDSKTPPSSAQETIPASVHRPASLPAHVSDDASQDCVLAYERLVSHPVAASSLREGLEFPPDEATSPSLLLSSQQQQLLTTYLRATMKAFARTPQAYVIRAALGPDARRTFGDAHIDGLEFRIGDRVAGVYTVAYRGCRSGEGIREERVELMLDAPSCYRGPVVEGLIAAAVELLPDDEIGDEKELVRRAVFVNETWMWRKPEEKPTMLEGKVGSWLHSLLAGWLVTKGLDVVTK